VTELPENLRCAECAREVDEFTAIAESGASGATAAASFSPSARNALDASSRATFLCPQLRDLDGEWRVRRESGLLPPMFGVRKVVAGDHGWTTLGPVRAGFDVVGNELRYRGALRGFVDVLERDGNEWRGRALLRGREYGRFRLMPISDESDEIR